MTSTESKACLALTLALIALFLNSCITQPIPKFGGRFYAANSATESIDRAQDKDYISCKDPKFDQYLCLSYQDYKLWVDTYVLSCKQWGQPPKTLVPAFKVQKDVDTTIKSIGHIPPRFE